MATTTPDQSEKDSNLLYRLPPEIRTQIYELVLTSDEPIELHYFPGMKIEPKARMWPAILQLSKKINHEALPSLYSKNLFCFHNIHECQKFCNPAIPGRALVKRVCLCSISLQSRRWDWGWLPSQLPTSVEEISINVGLWRGREWYRELRRGITQLLKRISDASARREYFESALKIIAWVYADFVDINRRGLTQVRRACVIRPGNAALLYFGKRLDEGPFILEDLLRSKLENDLTRRGVFEEKER